MKIKSIFLTTIIGLGMTQAIKAATLTADEVTANKQIKKALKKPTAITFKKERNALEAIQDLKELIAHLKGKVFNDNLTPDENKLALFPSPSSRCLVLLKDTTVILFEVADILTPNAPEKGKEPSRTDKLRTQVAGQLEDAGKKLENAIKNGKLEIVSFVAGEIFPIISKELPSVASAVGSIPVAGATLEKVVNATKAVLDSLSKVLGSCSTLSEAKAELAEIDISDLPTA